MIWGLPLSAGAATLCSMRRSGPRACPQASESQGPGLQRRVPATRDRGRRAQPRRSAAPLLLAAALLLLVGPRAAAGFHEGDFIHASKRSQYLQVCGAPATTRNLQRATRPRKHC